MKELLINAPTLHFPGQEYPLKVATDASDYGIAGTQIKFA